MIGGTHHASSKSGLYLKRKGAVSPVTPASMRMMCFMRYSDVVTVRTMSDGERREKEEKGPYSSIASVCLMIARELLREGHQTTKRDAPQQLPQ